MPSQASITKTSLLFRLAEKYEASASYDRPAPWRADLIVRLDERAFPAEWRAGNADAKQALFDAAVLLAEDGAARLEFPKRQLEPVPLAVRVGPLEIGRLMALAEREGFETASAAIERLAALCQRLSGELPQIPMRFRRFLDEMAARAREGDVSMLAANRATFKKSQFQWLDAIKGAAHIAAGTSGYERVVSQRIFRDSKRLRLVYGKVVDLLRRTIGPESAGTLEEWGVLRVPTSLTLAGDINPRLGDHIHYLGDYTPAAEVPEAWAEELLEAIRSAGIRTVTTVENLTPYLAYLEEMGGNHALGRRGEIVLFTSGTLPLFWLNEIKRWAEVSPSLQIRHWPDPDYGGLRIWWTMRQRIGRQIEIFRVDEDWIERAVPTARVLRPGDALSLEALRLQMATTSERGADIARAVSLIDKLLEKRLRFEQEAFLHTR